MSDKASFFAVAVHRDQDPYFAGVMVRAQGTREEMEALIGTYPGHDCQPIFFDDYQVGTREAAAFLAEYNVEDDGYIIHFHPRDSA